VSLRAVIFDVGDVLIRTLDERLRMAWEQRLGLHRGQAEQIVFGAETGWAPQLGLVSVADHWQWVAERLGLDTEGLVQFRKDFFARDVLDARLLAHADKLRAHFHLGLLSNAMLDARQLFAERYGFLSHFDSATISAEEGTMKPDPAIYQVALRRAGVAPHEALFVDDSLRNIEGARALGMQAIHYVDPELGRRQLIELTGVEE
jgi:HAD superfamily hydrolase (TIGR01509 family)